MLFRLSTTEQPRNFFMTLVIAALVSILPGPLSAQQVKSSLMVKLNGAPTNQQTNDPVQLKSEFKLMPDSNEGVLIVKATIKEGWHTYSITQKPGGPIASKLTVAESKEYQVGKFQATKPPKKKIDKTFNMEVEQHEGQITWMAPLKISPGIDPAQVKVKLVYNGGACESRDGGTCVPIFDVNKTASFAGRDKNAVVPIAKIKLNPFQPEGIHGKLTGRIFHPENKPWKSGDKIKLEVTMQCSPGYHVYGYATPNSDSFTKTTIQFIKPDQWQLTGPTASAKPKIDKKTFGPDKPVYYHDKVTWTFDLVVPEKPTSIQGQVMVQTCTDAKCDPPADIDFTLDNQSGNSSQKALKFSPAKLKADQLSPASKSK